jgi:hypothetical protein
MAPDRRPRAIAIGSSAKREIDRDAGPVFFMFRVRNRTDRGGCAWLPRCPQTALRPSKSFSAPCPQGARQGPVDGCRSSSRLTASSRSSAAFTVNRRASSRVATSSPPSRNSRSSREQIFTNGDECRARAAECDQRAEQAKNAEAKRLLQQAATEWRTMAVVADRHAVWDARRFSPLKDE